jgi:hypothetical protein
VLAVDLSPVVLERAKNRRKWTNVEFQAFDLRSDALPGFFDLIVVASVLETFYRPADLHAAREKLIAAMLPGSYLLIGNVRGNEFFEQARWTKWLIRGGKRISEFFGCDDRLKLIAQKSDDLYIDSLFRRSGDPLHGGRTSR